MAACCAPCGACCASCAASCAACSAASVGAIVAATAALNLNNMNAYRGYSDDDDAPADTEDSRIEDALPDPEHPNHRAAVKAVSHDIPEAEHKSWLTRLEERIEGDPEPDDGPFQFADDDDQASSDPVSEDAPTDQP